jgi:hypothetical protein
LLIVVYFFKKYSLNFFFSLGSPYNCNCFIWVDEIEEQGLLIDKRRKNCLEEEKLSKIMEQMMFGKEE